MAEGAERRGDNFDRFGALMSLSTESTGIYLTFPSRKGGSLLTEAWIHILQRPSENRNQSLSYITIQELLTSIAPRKSL